MESKYKIGDKVRIKSLDWYNSNKDETDEIFGGYVNFTELMSKDCGKECEIRYVFPNGIYLLEGNIWCWADWMFEDKPNLKLKKNMKKIDVLIKARELYKRLIPNPIGMCYCLKNVLYEQDGYYDLYYYAISYNMLVCNFPEFSPKYFKLTTSTPGFWWNIEDTESRLKAFDTLIELYKNSTEEFVNDTYLLDTLK